MSHPYAFQATIEIILSICCCGIITLDDMDKTSCESIEKYKYSL